MSAPTIVEQVLEECVTCAKLPKRADADGAGDFRPDKPRPIDTASRGGTYGGPRSLRCATHYRAHRNAAKQRSSDGRSRKRSGLPEPKRVALLELQGRVCAGCSRGAGRKRRNLSADHDHDLAAAHDHAEDVACEDCMRGYLCTSCNRDIIGMLRGRMGDDVAVRTVLETLAGYLAEPPMVRLRRTRPDLFEIDPSGRTDR